MSWNNINIQRNTIVASGYSITGELVDTSDKKKKYDIKDVDDNFIEIVKNIKPKTFKMNDEKEIGMTKNHLGFIADEITSVIPSEWENIVMVDNEGIKKLSYIKMGSITWGAVREIIKENEDLKNKVEHLEASVYELQEAVKELMKTKPKAKAKTKAKE